ncbi:DNA replication and repair protein RecO [Thiogranum longum]|uniref:DNA repair protein RecO n=1 Tax=Thiogranum longum TaxID=1537524 RepID=A0A4R1HAR0_9GAMM|nr:DNA repair protein RecO [Thiogranum longum]TCK17583.1 DNA replication and repair protein RecO [Thiogranum longum]
MPVGSASRVELTPGFVLHQRPYRETSALLEIFTPTHGRVGLVARGVYAPKSRRRGELQAFRALRLSWNERGELGTLTGVESDGPGVSLAGAALYSAFYLNELLVRLLVRHDPHPLLYERYRQALQALSDQPAGIELTLRLFEKQLLQETGYGLLLDVDCETGEPVQADRFYDYHLEAGPVASIPGSTKGFLFPGSSLLALAQESNLDEVVLRDAKRLMRAALSLYLGGKPLKSRELFVKA